MSVVVVVVVVVVLEVAVVVVVVMDVVGLARGCCSFCDGCVPLWMWLLWMVRMFWLMLLVKL